MLGWVLGLGIGLVVVLGAIAVVIGLQTSQQADDIPKVTDVSATVVSKGTVRFSWPDPGIEAGDRYQVQVGDGSPSLQTRSSFTVAGASGEVCLTVTVNRSGRTGDPSVQKCVNSGGS